MYERRASARILNELVGTDGGSGRDKPLFTFLDGVNRDWTERSTECRLPKPSASIKNNE